MIPLFGIARFPAHLLPLLCTLLILVQVNYLNYPSPNNDVVTLSPSGVLFRKVYDSGDNVLAGNCDVGQLTQKGFLQEITNVC
mgnify:FL=1